MAAASRDSATDEHPPGVAAQPAASQEPTTSYTIDVDLELVPVTPLTPIPAAIDMDVRVGEGAGEGELQLLPITLGKGAFGRVVVGLYGASQEPTTSYTIDVDLELVPVTPLTPIPAAIDMDVRVGEGAGEGELQLLPITLGKGAFGRVLHIVMQIGRALSYMHPTILHRDLKPANVLVSNADSEAPVIKLGDFGLARLRDTILVTREPEVGTGPYVSPEAFDPANFAISDRADMYALGVILGELLSGMRPWGSMSNMQVRILGSIASHKSHTP
ncbi:hypothetical protein GPECTOR_12g486 [Gonium pectorale]|uniref:Protein kinase domain-containing protein n=1 Tax=Gonium pectorale TaxID=33097 RepID=A0A150GNV6_GONPE|nr:hypothetical protein GPECTOR_12g486 [Gonium pectorale]|eukprot:KXZ51523.1 hypothetical protein GPECTOR_12g486 [Gonium pectorale]